MTDLIRRDDAYAAIRGLTRHIDRIAAITALPAVQPDAREAALREAVIVVAQIESKHRTAFKYDFDKSAGDKSEGADECLTAISALIDKPAVQPDPHVNETPKSEHDARDVLTPSEHDRGFVMLMERAERAEAEVARLTALLPHPGETAQEVMWRNHQRGVRLEELAKAAGVTRERARQMVRKAEARLAKAHD